MSSTVEAKARCLCGAVEMHSDAISSEVGACHCNMCRKWGGGAFMALECVGELKISGEENIISYPSSEWAERGFCSTCGTHLFYKVTSNNQYMVPAGLFNVEDKLNFDHQIFVDEKPKYYSFSNKTENLTGAEAMAQFAS